MRVRPLAVLLAAGLAVGCQPQAAPQPRLALRWENPDERTWRFTLDPAARFSDGEPLRASDVKASFARARSLAGSDIAGLLRLVESVETVDEHTVDVRTERPVALLADLSWVLIARESRAVVPGLPGPLPLGTGPFRLTRFEEGRGLRLEPNPHHARRSAWSAVDLRVATGEAFGATLERERPDLGLFFTYAEMERLRARRPSGLRLEQSEGLFVVYLALNLRERLPGAPQRNPLSDARVRQALSLATDRQAVARDGLGGTARPARQMVVPAVFGYDASAPPLAEHAQRARELLASAGFPGGLEIELLRSTRGSGRIEGALTRAWKDAGIRARERFVEDPSGEAEAGRFQAVVQGFACSTGDAGEALGYLLHSRRGTEWGSFNYGGYGPPELDRMIEGSLAVFDPRERLELMRLALRRAAEDLPVLPLVARDDVYVVSDRVRLVTRPDGMIRFPEVAPVAP